jgi:pectinesterase
MSMGLLALAGRPAVALGRGPFDAVVEQAASAQSGRRFAGLQQAIDAAPPDGKLPYRIFLGPGTWQGPFLIDRPRVQLIGAGVQATRLIFAAGAGQIAPDGKPYGTFRTAALKITAPDVHLSGLSIENSYDAVTEMHKPNGLKADLPGSQQAIALTLDGDTDRAVIRDCHLASHQDTLYCARRRALFTGCTILGSYDFIFGGGAARFEGCTIVSRPRVEPVEGYIAAPSTLLDQAAGLVFDGCDLTAQPGVPDGSVFLGRPWRASTMVGASGSVIRDRWGWRPICAAGWGGISRPRAGPACGTPAPTAIRAPSSNPRTPALPSSTTSGPALRAQGAASS